MIHTHLIGFRIFSDLILPLSVALIMFGMGLSLTIIDFKRIILRPRPVILGLLVQMIFLPLFAFLLAAIAPLDPALKVGLFLVAICPGGSTANLINYLLNGHLALSVSLTTVNAFLTQFTIPALFSFGLMFFMGRDAQVELPFLDAVIKIFLVTLLPVFLGIIMRNMSPDWSARVRRPLKYIMPVPLAVAMIGAAFFEHNEVNLPAISDYFLVLPWMILLNVCSFFGAWYFAKKTNLDNRSALTIAVEVGLQNTAMALFIASGRSLALQPQIAVPAAIYAMFSLITTALMGYTLSKKSSQS
jgi:BASS family bile acid:Na+ symporter